MNRPHSWTDYHARLSRVTAYIHDHLAEELDLNRLAEVAHLSPFHWHRVYHVRYGETHEVFRFEGLRKTEPNALPTHHVTSPSLQVENALQKPELLSCDHDQEELLSQSSQDLHAPTDRYHV